MQAAEFERARAAVACDHGRREQELMEQARTRRVLMGTHGVLTGLVLTRYSPGCLQRLSLKPFPLLRALERAQVEGAAPEHRRVP
jgi:hypothetical protein